MKLKDRLLKSLLGRHHEKLFSSKIEKNMSYIDEKLDELELKSGDVVLDLGANIGLFSACCLNRGAKVHAFEPNPFAAEKLIADLGDHPNLIFHQAAVSNTKGQLKLYFHKHHNIHPQHMSESSSLFADKVNVSDEHVLVQTVDISDVLSELSRIDLIKIDVEGAEYDLVDGIFNNIEKIGHVVMETHGTRIPSLNDKHAELVERIKSQRLGNKIYLDWM